MHEFPLAAYAENIQAYSTEQSWAVYLTDDLAQDRVDKCAQMRAVAHFSQRSLRRAIWRLFSEETDEQLFLDVIPALPAEHQSMYLEATSSAATLREHREKRFAEIYEELLSEDRKRVKDPNFLLDQEASTLLANAAAYATETLSLLRIPSVMELPLATTRFPVTVMHEGFENDKTENHRSLSHRYRLQL